MANPNPFKVTALAAAMAAAGAVTPAYALFTFEEGDFKIQADTTVSVGASWRASDVDYRNVGDWNAGVAAGSAPNPNNPSGQSHFHGTSSQDNSDLLWKKGSTFSEVIKISADLELNYKNYGAFIRGRAFYDHRIINGDGVTDKPNYYRQNANGDPLEPHQSDGRSADIQDAFIWGDWFVADKPINVRLGRQVINWGEGIFFANGINTINPIDVGALLTPGSEVKDALIPLGALYGSVGITDSLSVEAFALFEWKETEVPACGNFFSTSDLVGTNCYGGFFPSGLEAGLTPADGANFINSQVTHLERGDNIEADDGGQFGFAMRYFSDALQTEFAGYFINYHSQLPLIGGHMPVPSLVAVPGSVPLGALPDNLAAARGALTAGPRGALGTFAMFQSSDFASEFPEDIELVGTSFNTTFDLGLPGGETSVSGEVSWRRNQPFQIEDGLTLAALAGLPTVSCWDTNNDCYAKYSVGEYVPGYIRDDYYQAEIAFVHFFDQILGAARWTAILDFGYAYADFPGQNKTLLNGSYNATLNAPGIPDDLVNTGQLAGVLFSGAAQVPYTTFLDVMSQFAGVTAANPEDDYFPTHEAWGYKLRFTGEYNNVFAGINLRPSISFSHDVNGSTPGPISSFLENRKSLGLQLEADYLNTYSVRLGYTDFYGAEPYNQLADRDFYSLSASASF